MDLHVEVQCIDQMKKGQLDKFLLLFDAYFDEVYRYVARRTGEGQLAEEIVNFIFLDALGQVQSTPTDIGYLIWLYSIARPRAWDKVASDNGIREEIISDLDDDVKGDILKKTSLMLQKMSMEEKEILRLKFFEEVSDGDVMVVLGSDEGLIGPKIYRVLKQAHQLLFGESDERQGVYFGELSGFLARVRDLEKIVVPQAFKLSLRSELRNRIERRGMAVELDDSGAVIIEEEVVEETDNVAVDEAETDVDAYAKKMPGSNDPAKIFVEAAKKMTKEDWADIEREQMAKAKIKEVEESLKQVKSEPETVDIYTQRTDFIERFRPFFFVLPLLLIFGFVGWWVSNLISSMDQIGVSRIASTCPVEIVYEDDFKTAQVVQVNREVSNLICDYFEVEGMTISQTAGRYLYVDVDLNDVLLKYRFVQRSNIWRVKRYEKSYKTGLIDSNQEPRQV